jgi:hypothetical protein
MIFKLTKPITAHGAEIAELELREPTGQEIIDIGFPYLIVIGDDDEQSMRIQVKTVAKYISKLSGIPPSSVGNLSPNDISRLAGVVLSFFGVQAEA